MCSNKTDEVLYDVSLEETKKDHIVWYWLDLYKPTKEEYTYILQDHFKFHPLAIEDCIEYVQRPKVDFMMDITFSTSCIWGRWTRTARNRFIY